MEGRQMPQIQKTITGSDIGDNIICFSGPPVGFKCYLVRGTKKAALIDSGMGIGSLKTEVLKYTDLPIVLINTHCHPDHAGGNAEFDPALINPADMDVFKRMATKEFRTQDIAHMPGDDWASKLQPTGPDPIAASDGQIIDLGGRQLEIIFTPGHTHGSLCVYEEATGVLFSGDNIQGRTTALREWNSTTVLEFYNSLLKLRSRNIRRILTGHVPNDNPGDLLERKIKCTKKILNGVIGEAGKYRDITTYIVEYEGTSVEYLPDRIR
ncbi:MAG: MBL fold metallo-hydrolase [Lachnospiraceae bacterium]|jgi:hydroxyacylglutathione hydrolase|nr:MBL fold metallo-hydrolase [Lachnospiraceae bacterium]